VFKRRILSASLALLVGASAFAPWAASAVVPAPDPAWEADAGAVATDPGRGADDAQTTPEAAEAQEAGEAPKRKGNAFGRILSAPFRALARLFKSDRKVTTTARRQAPPAPEPMRAQAPHLATPPALGTVMHPPAVAANPAAVPAAGPLIVADAPAPAGAPLIVAPAGPVINAAPVNPVVPAAPVAPSALPAQNRAAEVGARVVRPGEFPGAPSVLPRRFVPVIEGVGRDPLSQGRALLQHGYLNEAISELSVAATTVGPNSNLVEANNLLGLAYDRLGSHREAAEAYRRALTVAPSDPVVLANLGYSLYLSNDLDGALRHLKQAARISPSLSVVHNNMGIVQARLGKYDEALRSFARASNQYDAHLKVAAILESDKRDRQAVKHYEAALRIQPNTSAVLERLVALYERTGQRDKAETARRALGQPSNPQRTTTGGG